LAFIFDLDGVIIHSMPVHNQAWERYLSDLGIVVDAIEPRMHGRRNDEIVRDFFGEGLSENEISTHGAAKEALYRELMQPQLRQSLVPGIEEFLQRHRGTPMGLASNAEPANVDFILDGAGLRSYFQAIVDGHQVDRPKPHPDIYLRTAELLKITPENCIIFEDSAAGVEAARAAGARVVGVMTTPVDLAGVDLIVRDYRELNLESWLCEAQPKS
jgi:beta-phosphoglucomutase